MTRRSARRKLLDFLTFPVRAVSLFHDDRWGLSSLATERFDYVAREVRGSCLDIGCGRGNRFVREFLDGRGRGIDVFPYAGLADEDIFPDLSCFPFPDGTFETVTFIANLNHVPERLRDVELREAHRVLAPAGRIVVTMGNPLAEVLVHQVVWLYDRVLGTRHDVDSERGMDEEEKYFLTDQEIVDRLSRAGFGRITKKHFATQWAMNHLFVAEKT